MVLLLVAVLMSLVLTQQQCVNTTSKIILLVTFASLWHWSPCLLFTIPLLLLFTVVVVVVVVVAPVQM